jgi:CheY-like chemotaxis protein
MSPPGRILVVHDEPALGELLVRLLQDAGYAAEAVHDGRLIWRAAQANGEPFVLLVTNCLIPEVPGSEVLALLSGEYPGAPILHLDLLHNPQPDECTAPLYTPFCRELFLAEVRRLLALSQPPERLRGGFPQAQLSGPIRTLPSPCDLPHIGAT